MELSGTALRRTKRVLYKLSGLVTIAPDRTIAGSESVRSRLHLLQVALNESWIDMSGLAITRHAQPSRLAIWPNIVHSALRLILLSRIDGDAPRA